MDTQVARVPRIKTALNGQDLLGAIKTRLGIKRDNYKVAPGLYAVGHPTEDAPVLVTADYKLSFDHLRRRLKGVNAWLLVLDTRGINVWCAAGKGTFGTGELVRQIRKTNLEKLVRHRRIIVPQLGAPGVSAFQVKRQCGFEVIWGPIRAEDVNNFLRSGFKTSDSMRRVSFTFPQRLVLAPVELYLIRKTFLWAALVIFLVSGIGAGSFFSLSAAWHRGLLALGMCITGAFAGGAFVPMLLPWLPTRIFAVKGCFTGVGLAALYLLMLTGSPYLTVCSGAALLLFGTTVSSFLAMNFTGSTPYTSPSGVESEMRRAIPAQIVGLVVALLLWIVSV
ncbi:MAG: hypothetical protein GY874_16725 [Desulfobacteraceae bacterium]|nr:hypothetical protein [Desulfobacteraceae bacterium]